MVRDRRSGCDELHIAGRADLKGVEEVGITYKEYVWLVKPNDIIETFCGGVYGCPIEYGISNKGFDCLPDVKKCEYCMNQEIPYPVIAEVIRDTYLNPFEKNNSWCEIQSNRCGYGSAYVWSNDLCIRIQSLGK